jgi:hypothetical protein
MKERIVKSPSQAPHVGADDTHADPFEVITFPVVDGAIAGIVTHSIATTPAETRVRVVSEACHNSIFQLVVNVVPTIALPVHIGSLVHVSLFIIVLATHTSNTPFHTHFTRILHILCTKFAQLGLVVVHSPAVVGETYNWSQVLKAFVFILSISQLLINCQYAPSTTSSIAINTLGRVVIESALASDTFGVFQVAHEI